MHGLRFGRCRDLTRPPIVHCAAMVEDVELGTY